ncbi:MAG TPA: carboxypeptidase M32 [Myxococcaceae bacterium]|nr:carboxypeptidase M32 [Myxococcaceae bacterium]
MDDARSLLLARMRELKDLAGIIGLATWDQETHLPPKAEPARASQLSTLQGLYHQRLVAPEVGDWLARWTEAPGSDDERAMARVLTRERDRAVRVPAELVRNLAEAQGAALTAWRVARDERSFRPFAPALERLLALRREQADAIGYEEERYDALLDGFEPGMRTRRLRPVLHALRDKLIPLVQALAGWPPPPDLLAGLRFPAESQWRFTVELLGRLGFDLEAGRQDKSIHPFTGGTHPTDVRLTTRIAEDNLFAAVFGTLHECGHGLYEQGFQASDYRTPLAAAPSMGLHESQSRLWENLIGRSLPFWRALYPRLQHFFPGQLGAVGVEQFHATLNRVQRTPVRVEADEVTYNLHIVLRTELEIELLRGNLPVSELPGAWDGALRALLGIEPPDVVKGVLQDIHWAWGELGYFPTYALGNLYAASLLRAAERALPDLWTAIGAGDVAPLRNWLRTRVHAEGSRLDAEDLVRKVTGAGLTDTDFVAYLHGKYGALTGRTLPRAHA